MITNPGDLRALSVNTAFRPGDPDPAWSVMAPMPTARAAFATAAANGRVYAIGGAVSADCVTVPTVEAYDPDGDFWITDLAPMPPPLRFRPSGATLDKTIYVVGGATKNLSATTRPSVQSKHTTPRPTVGQRSHLCRQPGFKLVLA